jgi:TM2 domain-containing membrane protein YozV
MTTPPGQPPHSDPANHDPSGWPPPHQPGAGQQPHMPYGTPEYGQQPGYPQAGYPAAGYPAGGYPPDASAPYGYDAMGRPYSDKQKLVAGLLGILLGWLGVGRFYTGHTGLGVAQLVLSLVTCGLGSIWGLIDGILILVNGGTDAQGRPLRD